MVDPAPAPRGDAGAKGEVRVQELDRLERTIARRSAEARATVPDVELSAEVDMESSVALMDKSASGITAIIARACALALHEVPRANAAYRDGRFELYSRVNVGVTIAAADTYTIPTVFDCDRKSLAQLSDEIAGLGERAQTGELSPSELGGATFTLANVGDLGVASSAPLIVPPQAAAVAAGTIREAPVVRNGAIVPGHTMTLTLACDHRILYGAQAAGFLARIRSRLEDAVL